MQLLIINYMISAKHAHLLSTMDTIAGLISHFKGYGQLLIIVYNLLIIVINL